MLRTLRQVRKQLRDGNRCKAEDAIDQALQAVRELDIPHLELLEFGENEIVH